MERKPIKQKITGFSHFQIYFMLVGVWRQQFSSRYTFLNFFLLQTDDELLVILHGFIVKNIEGESTEANDLSDIF